MVVLYKLFMQVEKLAHGGVCLLTCCPEIPPFPGAAVSVVVLALPLLTRHPFCSLQNTESSYREILSLLCLDTMMINVI